MFNLKQKIFLYIPTGISLGMILYFGFIPPKEQWNWNGMTGYYLLVGMAQFSLYLQSFILLHKIWKNEGIEREAKKEWTWAMLIVGFIANNIFIWNKSNTILEHKTKHKK